jgi:hypothetical protein
METNEVPRRRAAIGQVHLAHPRCPSCGRALYKSPQLGARVTKRQRYAWCRSTGCRLAGRDVADVLLVGGVLVDLRSAADRAALGAVLEGWR